jgi:PilZ domain
MPRHDHSRAHGRRRIALPAVLQWPTGEGEVSVRVLDLSLAGACLEVPRPIIPGTRVVLDIVAPTLWDPLVLPGLVIWARGGRPKDPSRVGLQFEHQDGQLLFALFDLLAAHDFEA